MPATIDTKPVEQIEPLNKELPVTASENTINKEDEQTWLKTEVLKILKVKQASTATPTYIPISFIDQIAFSGKSLYANIDSTWYEVSGGRYFAGTDTRSTTGDKTLTCGFTPKMIKITAFSNAQNAGLSLGVWTSDSGNDCMTRYRDTNWINTLQEKIIAVPADGGTNETRATITATSSTGATLTFSAAPTAISYIYEIYG